jgi:hypothetical protein
MRAFIASRILPSRPRRRLAADLNVDTEEGEQDEGELLDR